MNRKARRAMEFNNQLSSGFVPKRRTYLLMIEADADWDLASKQIYIQHQLDQTVERSMDDDKWDIQIYRYPPLAH
jgi:hypothetical protein